MSDTVAFIDVGTNSIHMIVVGFRGDSLGTVLFHDKETIRMGKGLYENGLLDADTINKAAFVLQKFSDIAKDNGATEIIAMATCAAREAPNRSELVEAARNVGVELRVIPGKEEARLIRLGVLGPDSARRTLCIDVGGGSTELALADGKEDLYLDSLSLGAIRMAYGSGVDQTRKITPKQYESLKRKVDAQCYRSIAAIKELGFDDVVGSSGTMEAIADACAAKRGNNDASYISRTELKALMRQLCGMTSAERARIPKISASRADIVIGGGVVVEELMDLLGIERMTVSRAGLREGMKTEYLLEHGCSEFSPRSDAVRNLAVRCGCDTSHEKAVVRYAEEICGEFVKIGLLSEGDPMKELLGYAAHLHDVGSFISYERHNVHSYIIIRNSYLAGFDSSELEKMALLARFHHGSFPREDSKMLAAFDRQTISEIRKYAMVLKMADIMDRCRDSAVDSVTAEKLNGNVNITVSSESDISLVIWKLRSIAEDFLDVFGFRMHVDFLRL